MATTFYPQARISRPFAAKKPRRVLKAPERTIALRTEYITENKTTLLLKPQGTAESAAAYKIIDEDDIVLFTVTGWKFYSNRSCREFRDASGLPLFELHRNWLSLRNGFVWSVTLPGGASLQQSHRRSLSSTSNAGGGAGGGAGSPGVGTGVLATGSPRIRSLGSSPFGNFNFTIEQNAAAAYTKNDEDKKLTLEIERHGSALGLFDVVDGGDRKVAELRESIQHNKRLPLISSQSGYRPVLDLVVTAGVDLSLVSCHWQVYFHGVVMADTESGCHYCGDCIGLGLEFKCLMN